MRVVHFINHMRPGGGAQKIIAKLVKGSGFIHEICVCDGGDDPDFGVVGLGRAWVFSAIVELLKRNDAIFVVHSRKLLFLCPIARIIGRPFVFVCHNIFPSFSWVFGVVGLSHVVAVSDAVGVYLARYLPPGRVEVIQNGVFDDVACPSGGGEPLPLARRRDLAFVGRLERVKGIDFAIDVLREIADEDGIDIVLHVVGRGSLEQAVLAANKGRLRTVAYGYRENPFAVIGGVEILVVPSIHEGFGLVLAEGIGNAKLALASDIPPLREVGEDRFAVFVPPGDKAAWKRVLRDALAGEYDGVLKTVTSEAADYRARYSFTTMCERYDEIFARIWRESGGYQSAT